MTANFSIKDMLLREHRTLSDKEKSLIYTPSSAFIASEIRMGKDPDSRD